VEAASIELLLAEVIAVAVGDRVVGCNGRSLSFVGVREGHEAMGYRCGAPPDCSCRAQGPHETGASATSHIAPPEPPPPPSNSLLRADIYARQNYKHVQHRYRHRSVSSIEYLVDGCASVCA